MPLTLDRIQAWFAPLVILLAALTFIIWMWWRPAIAWDQTIALILVACPCALGLAAPLTYALAVGRAARQGILLRDSAALEELGHCHRTVLDKTGTLTTGVMTVIDWTLLDATQPEALAACSALARTSDHPAARALAEHLSDVGQPRDQRCELTDVCDHPGKGLSAVWQGHDLRIGRPGFVSNAIPPSEHSQVALSMDGKPLATATLDDPLRPGARELVERLESQGLPVTIASGDNPAVVERIGAQLGLPAERCLGALSPDDKTRVVSSGSPTLMIGDGVNDAAALQAARVGIGLRGGLEAGMACSSVFCTRPDLSLVHSFLDGARATTGRLHLALGLSITYNLIGVVAVMVGWWGPYVCAIAMPLSSLSVVALVATGSFFGKPAHTGNNSRTDTAVRNVSEPYR
jgi:Cu2+-exporting ATPase